MRKPYIACIHKDYTIEAVDISGRAYYSVIYCGDEVVFDTMDDAKSFIDKIM